MELTTRNLKVLVTEDHFLSRQIITGVLQNKGITKIFDAVNGQEACDMINDAQLARIPFHLVFLDWEMPVMTGIEVLKYFRAQPQFNDTAFVMVTAVADQKHVIEAVKAGATSYIIKPVAPAAIAKKFDEIMIWIKSHNVA